MAKKKDEEENIKVVESNETKIDDVKKEKKEELLNLHQILDIMKIPESYKRYYLNVFKDKGPMTIKKWESKFKEKH